MKRASKFTLASGGGLLLLLAGCTCDYELELPSDHPARSDAPALAPVEVASPYDAPATYRRAPADDARTEDSP